MSLAHGEPEQHVNTSVASAASIWINASTNWSRNHLIPCRDGEELEHVWRILTSCSWTLDAEVWWQIKILEQSSQGPPEVPSSSNHKDSYRCGCRHARGGSEPELWNCKMSLKYSFQFFRVFFFVVVGLNTRTNVDHTHFIFTRTLKLNVSLCGNCVWITALLVRLGLATWLDFGLKYKLCRQKNDSAFLLLTPRWTRKSCKMFLPPFHSSVSPDSDCLAHGIKKL